MRGFAQGNAQPPIPTVRRRAHCSQGRVGARRSSDRAKVLGNCITREGERNTVCPMATPSASAPVETALQW